MTQMLTILQIGQGLKGLEVKI